MRTTVRLDEHLAKRAKRYALEHDKTFTSVIEESLREYLDTQQSRAAQSGRLELPTFGGAGNGLRPGIDLDDGSALQELDDLEKYRF